VLPAARLTRRDVRFTYSGVRPLPYAEGKKAGSITRAHILHDHTKEGARKPDVPDWRQTHHPSSGRGRVCQSGVPQAIKQSAPHAPPISVLCRERFCWMIRGGTTPRPLWRSHRAPSAGSPAGHLRLPHLRLLALVDEHPDLASQFMPHSRTFAPRLCLRCSQKWPTPLKTFCGAAPPSVCTATMALMLCRWWQRCCSSTAVGMRSGAIAISRTTTASWKPTASPTMKWGGRSMPLLLCKRHKQGMRCKVQNIRFKPDPEPFPFYLRRYLISCTLHPSPFSLLGTHISNMAQDAAFIPLPPILGGSEFQSPPILGDFGGHQEQLLQPKDLCVLSSPFPLRPIC
jgi:hypothetical protein